MPYDADAYVPPEREWLLLTGQTGLVFAPRVISERQLIPEPQTAADTTLVEAALADGAVQDPWAFCQAVLGWPKARVLGLPGGPALSSEASLYLPEQDTLLEPSWIVEGGGGRTLWVRVEEPGIEADQRGALTGWEATPAQRFERLLRERDIPAGVLITQRELRLIAAPRAETSGWISWRFADLATTAGRPMLGGLKLALGAFRLFSAPTDESLPELIKQSRRAQESVSTALAQQVLGALHELLRGFIAADPSGTTELATRDPHQVYEGLLTVLMRLVFVLYAEDRSLIPSTTEGEAGALYEASYSVGGLLDQLDADAALHPDTMDERVGGWGRLLALFRLIHGGHRDWIAARGGKLFDPNVFPFLEGRETREGEPRVLRVSDGCLHRVLSGLMRLEGERLSYRTLDVEQIGSVYETVMGFTVQPATGPSLAIRAGKNNRTPVFVDLEALGRFKAEARIKSLKEDSHRAQLSAKQVQAIKTAANADDLADALRPLVDERGSPGGQLAPKGTPVLQPTDERRRSGSHYTPRALTAPIVLEALRPVFDRLGPNPTPQAVLALKVCDPAMGSGAFLVEACRAMGKKLEDAYRAHAVPADIPPDETLELYACRRVAQACLYGVDKNPMAVDLARLSLWLLTLARDHEFAFLDHALKAGDSLVGLTLPELEAAHWDPSKPGHAVLRTIVGGKVGAALAEREAVRRAPESASVRDLAASNATAEAEMRRVRQIGDAVIAAFFSSPKPRARELARVEVEQAAASGDTMRWEKMETAAAALRAGDKGVTPFHWPLEFPEVFTGATPGFDAIVGNPPFAGKNTIIGGTRPSYLPWLQTLHPGAHGNADLVAHFFRRAFDLLKPGGVMGLIATNTIGQGDTRASGLTAILQSGGAISRATRRLKWPGEAAVVVSVVHVVKGLAVEPGLDGRQVRRISAYLVEGDLDDSPAPLAANSGKAFVGSYVLGMGFTFDDTAAARGEAESIATMEALKRSDPRNAERIFPYIGGEEVNTSPTQTHSRYIIDFADYPLKRETAQKTWAAMSERERDEALRSGVVPNDYPDPVAADWIDLLRIVERRVKPKRDKDNRLARMKFWWQYAERAPGLYASAENLPHVICTARVSPYLMISQVSGKQVYSEQLIVLTGASPGAFSSLQSRLHEVWARFFASTLEERLRYTPSDCFRTFPFSSNCERDVLLANAGQSYAEHRAALMITRNEGLTKTYNRFHDQGERAADIDRLRALHADMDRAVLEAYARNELDTARADRWRDLSLRAQPEFIEQEAEEGKTPKTRLDWPQAFKDEVLAALLDLNVRRAAEERSLGLVAATEDDVDDEDDPSIARASDAA